jgi:hypothetical protein
MDIGILRRLVKFFLYFFDRDTIEKICQSVYYPGNAAVKVY